MYILLFIVVLQFGYIIYKDYSFGKEREAMLLKIMSRDLQEYKEAIREPQEEEKTIEPDLVIPIEEASMEEILNAEDRI